MRGDRTSRRRQLARREIEAVDGAGRRARDAGIDEDGCGDPVEHREDRGRLAVMLLDPYLHRQGAAQASRRRPAGPVVATFRIANAYDDRRP